MNEVLAVINNLKERLYYWDGLIVLWVLSIYVFQLFVDNVVPHVINVFKPYVDGLEGRGDLFYLVGLLLVIALSTSLWMKKRSVPKFKKGDLGILFAPKFPDDIEAEIKSLMETLEIELKSHQLNNRFSIKRLPPNLSIASADEAERFIRDARATTAIWGIIDTQNENNNRITRFSKIFYTFVHNKVVIEPRRHELIALSLQEKKFQIEDRTRIADRALMAHDIAIVVRNLIGLSLLIDQKWGEAVKIFTSLIMSLEVLKRSKNSPVLNTFSMQVGYDLALALSMGTLKEYRIALRQSQLFGIPEESLRRWLIDIDKAINLDQQNSNHYFSKSIYYFLLGEYGEAIKTAKIGERMSPRALAIPNLSLAFLYNFTGDFKKSKQQYRIAMAKKTSHDDDVVVQCRVFIMQCIEKFPDKKQLHLALAIIELNRGSRNEGISHLEQLLSDPPASSKMRKFVTEAERMFSELKPEP